MGGKGKKNKKRRKDLSGDREGGEEESRVKNSPKAFGELKMR